MARFYIILACSLLLVAGANASCFQIRMSCKPGPFYGDIPGEEDTPRNCLDCTCNKNGNQVGCCNNIAVPVGYDTENCVALLDEENCRYNVVRVNNLDGECTVAGYNG